MLSYNKIINLNQQFAENHYGIKRFGNGQDFDMVLDNQEAPMRYPVMWMEDLPSPIETGLEHFAFRVWFLAQVEQLENRDDEAILVNSNEVKSDMKQLGIDFLSYWKQDSDYKDELRFEITTTWNYAELVQPDELTGGYFDVAFKVKQMFNRCIVPMGTITPPSIIYSDVTGNSTLMVSLIEGEDYVFQIKNESGVLVGSWNATTKTWTVPDAGGGEVTMTFNDAAITPTTAGDSKAISIISESFDPVGNITVDTAGQLTAMIANAVIKNKATTPTWQDSVYAEGSYILPLTTVEVFLNGISQGSGTVVTLDPDAEVNIIWT